MAILSLFAKLGLDGSGFKAGVKEAQKVSNDFGRDLKSTLKGSIAAAFSVAAIKGFADHLIETALRTKHLAEQFGTTTDEVQMMDKAAGKVGLSFENIESALGRIGEARKKAASDKGVRETFSGFGVSWDQVNNAEITNLEILKQVLKYMQDVGASERERIQFGELVGVRSEKLLALMKEMQNSQITLLTKDNIELVDEAHRKLKALHTSIEAFAIRGVTSLGKFAEPGISLKQRALRWLSGGILGSHQDSEALGGAVNAPFSAILGSALGGLNSLAGGGKVGISDDELKRKDTRQAYEAEQKLHESLLALEMARMSTGEKRKLVEKQINELLEDEQNFAEGGVEHSAIATELARKRLELFNLDKQHTNIEVDPMQRIGNQLGNALRLNATGSYLQANNPSLVIARGQLTVLQQMQLDMAAVARNTLPKTNQANF